MAGLEKDTPHPTALTVHTQSRVLEVGFDNGRSFRLPFELLRVYSPSAEVQGHGPGQEILQTGKRDVGISAVEPVGNYAILIRFSDGHDTGIYSWELLYRLGDQQDALWQDYLERLEAAGVDRDTPMPGAGAAGGHGCGHHH
ncbi:gamma-butyrobetaine hydroxylase-like domain-containing protein [Cupriavidus sp. NPDC089707]|uniref:gamma-butyrobetaine hydroxylase-like domain-containing protein n=1 Tax=Cupriavidus sp. NPDC089707 TaxID=3363963 RepID=UPI0037FEC42C